MTTTRHALSARMATTPFRRLASTTPVFADGLQGAVGWTAGSLTTLTRAFNDRRARYEMQQVSTDTGFPQTAVISRAITGLAVGKMYRVIAHAYGMAGGNVFAWIDTTLDHGNSIVLAPGAQELILDFTATATGTTLYLRTNTYAGSSAAIWQDIAVYEMAQETVLDLRPKEAQIALDESWAPYAQAVLTCPIPTKDVLSLVDPRKATRVILGMSQVGGDSLKAADLTSILDTPGTGRTNLVPNPRGVIWTDGWGGTTSSALTSPNVTTPNGVSGGQRMITNYSFAEPHPYTVLPAVGAGYYQVSVYVRCSVATNAQLRPYWPGGGVDGPVVALVANAWTRLDVASLVPESASFGIQVDFTGNTPVDTIYDITQVMVESLPVPPAIVTEVRRNLILNPSFETNTTGWTSTLGTLSRIAGGTVGSWCLQSSTGAGVGNIIGVNSMPVEEGLSYALSFDARVPAVTNAQKVRGLITWFTAAGVNLGQSAATDTALTTSFQRLGVVGVAPAGATKANVTIFASQATNTAGTLFEFDAVLFEQASSVGAYFDGDSLDAANIAYVWDGVAHASSSTATTTAVVAPVELPVGDYFDGGIGRTGSPRGLPDWIGVLSNSPSEKVLGSILTAARLSSIFGAPVRTNLMPNPSFETNTTSWTVASSVGALSRVTSGGHDGAAFGRLTTSIAFANPYLVADRVPTTAGMTSTVSMWVKGTAGLTVRVYATRFATASSAEGSGWISPVVTLTGSWQRVSVKAPAITGRPYLKVSLMLATATYPTGKVPAGSVLDVDGVLVEESGSLGAYFDGSTTPPAGYTNAWTGTAHASASTTTLTGVFTPASYFTDLFQDQYNVVADPALNVSRTFNLGLRERRLNYIDGTMTLVLAGDEALLQDYGRIDLTTTAWQPPATTSLKTLVNWALNLIGASLHASSSDFTIASADVIWNQGEPLWSFLDAFIQRAGLRLWCDENRVWYLKAPLTGSIGTVTISALTALDDVLSREDWADSVVVANEWTDPTTGNQTTTFAGAKTGATITKTLKVTTVSKATATTGAATALVTRTATRGRQVQITAVSNYNVTPGQTAYVSTPATTISPVMVSSVDWRFPDDEMNVSTRDLP